MVQRRARLGAFVAMGVIAAALPLVGLVSLLLRSQLDPHIENYPLHFVVFGVVGAVAFGLGYAAGEAANRRGDARVLLLSLAFMATGGFLWLHALGTPSILFSEEHAGFQVAIPVGLLVSAVFAAGSAFVDVRPGIAAVLIRRRTLLRLAVLVAMGVWFVWTVANLPPRGRAGQRSRHEPPSHRDRGPRNNHVRGQRRAVLEHLPSQSEPAPRGGRRLLRVAVRGDDRRCGHRGAQVARQLVGMARPDRHGLPDRRTGCSSRMARRAVPAALSADDAGAPPGRERPLCRSRRVHGLRRALVTGRGCSRARRVLGHRSATDHTSVRRGGGEVHRRRHHGHVQQQRRPARSRATSIMRRSGTATQGCPPGRADIRIGLACASASTAAA